VCGCNAAPRIAPPGFRFALAALPLPIPAQFGVPLYGGSVLGEIVYAANDTKQARS
jgi:hypothetical protein